MNNFLCEMRQRLEQLNRLEDQIGESRRRRDESLDDEALIESLRANISPSVLLHHDRLRARGRGSVAEMQHGVCSGCHMSLPVGTVASVKYQTELLTCQNCGRYVFPAEGQAVSVLIPNPHPSARRAAKT